MKILNSQEVLERIHTQKNPFWPSYKAMYSSWYGGIVTDPALMLLPLDDHLTHRGDGVFEALRFIDGKLWLGDAHFERLLQSAQKIELSHSLTKSELQNLCEETFKASGLKDSLLRIFLSRGPGAFSANPYDSVGAQLYLAACEFKAPPAKWIHDGVTVGKSQIPVKDPWLAQIKSCNYLQNVLMKKESVDQGFDFMVGINSAGNITESSTENIMWIDVDGFLCHPPLEGILAGTTMAAVCKIAKGEKIVPGIRMKDLKWQDVPDQKAFLMAGTTLDILPVQKVGDRVFQDFSMAHQLRELLQKAQTTR